MRTVGVAAVSFLLALFIFGYGPKADAASSGVIVATVQIKQPAQNTSTASCIRALGPPPPAHPAPWDGILGEWEVRHD